MTQTSPKSPNSKNSKWFLILAIITAILTGIGVVVGLVNIPEFRCFLLHLSCPPAFQDLTLYTQTEKGELLGGVEITVFGDGVPETTQTDDNGYAQVRIANKGVVKVNLSKSGYPPQNTTIDLKNPQDTVRTFKLSQSGQPEVIISSTPPPTPIPSTPPISSSPSSISSVDKGFMRMQSTGLNKNEQGRLELSFTIVNQTKEDLYIASNFWQSGSISDNQGHVCDLTNNNDVSKLTGLSKIAINDSNAKQPEAYTVISPEGTIVVGNSMCDFPSSTEFNASFGLLRYQKNPKNPLTGEPVPFSVGFTGLKLPEN